MSIRSSALQARVLHRYLGFFLVGIMAMYAITGVTLIFRNTDTFKNTTAFAKTVEPGLDAEALGKTLEIRRLEITKTEGNVAYFKEGTYDVATGEANYELKELPFVLGKLTKLHKATTDSPLYWLNIFFGVSLLFFVVSAIWMYLPGGPVLRKGLLFTAAGMVLVLVMLFV